MVEGHTMGFWIAFAVVLGILSLAASVALVAMVVSDISGLRTWIRLRRCKKNV